MEPHSSSSKRPHMQKTVSELQQLRTIKKRIYVFVFDNTLSASTHAPRDPFLAATPTTRLIFYHLSYQSSLPNHSSVCCYLIMLKVSQKPGLDSEVSSTWHPLAEREGGLGCMCFLLGHLYNERLKGAVIIIFFYITVWSIHRKQCT